MIVSLVIHQQSTHRSPVNAVNIFGGSDSLNEINFQDDYTRKSISRAINITTWIAAWNMHARFADSIRLIYTM